MLVGYLSFRSNELFKVVAYFLSDLTLAHLFFWASAILRLPAKDIVRRCEFALRVPLSTAIACSNLRISALISSIIFSIFILASIHFGRSSRELDGHECQTFATKMISPRECCLLD